MCRSCREGGRRCSGEAKDVVNERRRHNYRLRQAIASWAYAAGEDVETIQQLRRQAPGEARRWAVTAGLDPDTVTSLEGSPPQDDAWSDVQVIERITATVRLQGDHPVEQRLLTEAVRGVDQPLPLHSVTNVVQMVHLGSGQAFHKPWIGQDGPTAIFYGQQVPSQPLHEVAAWRLARHLGPAYERLLPATVLRSVSGHLGSLQAAAPGRHHPGSPYRDPSTWTRGAFFDALIGQQDRHEMNILVDDRSGTSTLIDHGFAFARRGDRLNESEMVWWRLSTPGAANLSTGERSALDRVLSSPDLFGLAGVIGPDRAAAVHERARAMRLRGRLLDLSRYLDG